MAIKVENYCPFLFTLNGSSSGLAASKQANHQHRKAFVVSFYETVIKNLLVQVAKEPEKQTSMLASAEWKQSSSAESFPRWE